MNIIELGQTILDSYNKSELSAKRNIPIYLAQCFYPHHFGSDNFLTNVNHVSEMWKFADSMQEFRTGYYCSTVMKCFSEAELSLIKKISLDYGNLIKMFNRKTIPIGINHQLSSIPSLRILKQLKDKLGESPSVFEVGGGSGMLGHMCHGLGYRYTGFDNTQSFYTFTSTMYKKMYGDKFYDTHNSTISDVNKNPKYREHPITMIPWWNFVNTDFSLPKFNVVIMNHCFFEISKKAMAFILTRLSYENKGRTYLIVSGWGSGNRTQLEKSFLLWLEKEFDFRKEEFCGDPLINPDGTVLLSFQKKSVDDFRSVPVEKRLNMKTNKTFNFKKVSNYIPTNLRPFVQFVKNSYRKLKKIFNIFLAKQKPTILGVRKPNLIKSEINLLEYNLNFSNIIKLIKEIESDLGKPSYTEDELLGFYIDRNDH